jgi:hypothetical protein
VVYYYGSRPSTSNGVEKILPLSLTQHWQINTNQPTSYQRTNLAHKGEVLVRTPFPPLCANPCPLCTQPMLRQTCSVIPPPAFQRGAQSSSSSPHSNSSQQHRDSSPSQTPRNSLLGSDDGNMSSSQTNHDIAQWTSIMMEYLEGREIQDHLERPIKQRYNVTLDTS